MSSYRQSLKTTRMQAVAADIDSGAGSHATLELVAIDATTVLAVFALASPPSSAVALSTLTLNSTPFNTLAVATGTVGLARIKNLSGAVVVDQMVVGTSPPADVLLSNLNLITGAPVQFTAATITHP